MKIYISGGITNVPDYSQRFHDAAERLRKDGHQVFDPAHIGGLLQERLDWDLDYEDFMEIDALFLRQCDAIYLLKDYEESEGARRELRLAIKLGKAIMYEEELP